MCIRDRAKIYETLSHIPTLNDVELEIWNCPSIGKAAIQGTAQLLRKCRDITSFKFTMATNENVDDEAVTAIASALRTHTKITNLAIDFTRTLATDESALAMIDAIFSQERLERISIRFGYCEGVTNQTAARLTELLPTQTSLNEFYFTVQNTGMNKVMLESMRQIGKRLV
eukprot:TRINITY_DN7883_c0_g1_i3.p1 TRINITY_DN7883_c0_g1~~TRINITY_DN7883_c0_g1_i3.p1  ORF type:complete len:190 (+),score=34.32 TRINITY_DN7883_c0_g1_i3:60-572(+)